MNLFNDEIASILNSYFADEGPGAVAGIFPDIGEPSMACTGLADLNSGLRLDIHTAFDLASVSKIFTAAAILKLSESGRLKLTDPVMPILDVAVKQQGKRPIMVQDLLWHISGIPDYLDSSQNENLPSELTPAGVMEKARLWLGCAEPGLKHEYSNTNYVILAEIISAVSGISWGEFIQYELLDPYGLTNSFIAGRKPEQVQQARGYQNMGFGMPRYILSEFNPGIVGDGGIFSSITDLARWQNLYFNGQILPDTTLKKAISQGRLDNRTEFNYGFGLVVENFPGQHTWCGHNGSWYGASAYTGRCIQEKVTVIVLSNEESVPVDRIAGRIYAIWKEKHENH